MSDGFKLVENFLSEIVLNDIEPILRKYNDAWIVKCNEFYKSKAVNSAYITNGDFISAEERLKLLQLVSSEKVVTEARKFLGPDAHFLNTQIFFNPFNADQKNYWHRDVQYTELTEEQQRAMIEQKKSQVIHLRLAFADENGLEFCTESHQRWDTEEENNVRLQKNGKVVWDNISTATAVPMKRGDLLVFDANIIHRGLYGKNRFAFDMMFILPNEETLPYVTPETLPKADELKYLEHPEIFSQRLSR